MVFSARPAASAWPLPGVIADVAQPVDIAPHGAHADAQALGRRGAGPVPAGLQQRQQGQQSRGRMAITTTTYLSRKVVETFMRLVLGTSRADR